MHRIANRTTASMSPLFARFVGLASAAYLALGPACSTSIGGAQEGTTDARSIDYRELPDPKEGTGTSPGCEGVTARGECQQGSAVYCDLDRGRLRRVDCEALGQSCILDISRGAVCKNLEEQDPAGPGASACSDTGISEQGFCTSAGEAVYCDTSGSAPVTRTWNCTAAGMTCGIDNCAHGAFCCDADGSTAGNLCEGTGLDFNGFCDGEVAKWCSDSVGPQEKDCTATGQKCEFDTCATGAYCCGEVETPGGGTTPEEECAAIGFAGVCDDDATLRYCFQDEIQVVTCPSGRTCQVDACINGAGCCEST